MSNKRVLILGAGASAPYGFPTGQELKTIITDKILAQTELFSILVEAGHSVNELETFAARLKRSGQMSIDAFLLHQPDFASIGKHAIACSLLPAESNSKLHDAESKEDWYPYLFQQLNYRRDEISPETKITILTFNYDRSLEQFLIDAMSNSFGISEAESAVRLRNTVRIVHLHGSLGPLQSQSENGLCYGFKTDKPIPRRHAVVACSQNLKVIHEIEDSDDTFEVARKILEQSDCVCFLGFGYHQDNLKRLGYPRRTYGQRVFGTAYGLTTLERQTVGGRLSNDVILGEPDQGSLLFLRSHPVLV